MKTWLITGASKGLGRSFALAALKRGDKVALTSRNKTSLEPTISEYPDTAVGLDLEVTDKASIYKCWDDAVAAFGKIDILVNNAGYIQLGAIEETTEEQARAEMETLFWGPYFMTQRAIPDFRKWGGGTFVEVSSLAGIGGLPGNSMYAAAKYAIEGMSEVLMREMKPFGIKVIILEPGGIKTSIGSGVVISDEIPGYEETVGVQRERWRVGGEDGAKGDPDICAERLLELVDMEEPPLRFLMSAFAHEIGVLIYNERLKEVMKYEKESRSISGE